MSNEAQRVLDALMEYDANGGAKYPITAIVDFFGFDSLTSVDEDYQALTAEEEKQVIQAFLEFAY